MYGVKKNNLKWFHSYLSNRKQYIEFQNDDKKEKYILYSAQENVLELFFKRQTLN